MAQIRLKQNITPGQTFSVPEETVQHLIAAGIAERVDGTETPATSSPAAQAAQDGAPAPDGSQATQEPAKQPQDARRTIPAGTAPPQGNKTR